MPTEVGGLHFSLMIVQNLALALFATKLYLDHYAAAPTVDLDNPALVTNSPGNSTDVDPVDPPSPLEARLVWAVVATLLSIFLLAVASLARLVDPAYLPSFWSTENASTYIIRCYFASTTDEQRMEIFRNNPAYYAPIKEVLKAYVEDNWAAWMAYPPSWFDDVVIARIPDEFLPVDEVERLNELGGGKRLRKNSLLGGRISIRGSVGGRRGSAVAPQPVVGVIGGEGGGTMKEEEKERGR